MLYYCKRCRSWSKDRKVPHKNFILSVMKASIRAYIEKGEKESQAEISLLEQNDLCYNKPTPQRTASDVF